MLFSGQFKVSIVFTLIENKSYVLTQEIRTESVTKSKIKIIIGMIR